MYISHYLFNKCYVKHRALQNVLSDAVTETNIGGYVPLTEHP